MGRSGCFARAERDAYQGGSVQPHCNFHDPPCLLQCSSTPALSKTLEEYERHGHDIPDPLPPQKRSSQGPHVLVTPVRRYSWQDNILVPEKELALPPVENSLVAKPGLLENSAGNFKSSNQAFLTRHQLDWHPSLHATISP
ncbi:hypothetical protein NM208_g11807 [Fusarium decemcellulare]|uniref:Uncharacterized protein n=1 Tax=Fusarium decemcellulare TaxID=57161 RepID=A0ACC1RRT7_9HYPO|nr:hypothetical protein NM208_g11807 [Fusarium decemcellulare]